MSLTEMELAFKHVTVFVHVDALSMSQIFKPLSVILAFRGNFLTHSISDTFEPFAIINVGVR